VIWGYAGEPPRGGCRLSSIDITAQVLSREFETLLPGVSDGLVDAQLPIAGVDQSLAPGLQDWPR
jgi:hypothetical protein